MNIKEMTEVELKSLGFDEQQKIQISQNNLAIIIQELNSRKPIKELDQKDKDT